MARMEVLSMLKKPDPSASNLFFLRTFGLEKAKNPQPYEITSGFLKGLSSSPQFWGTSSGTRCFEVFHGETKPEPLNALDSFQEI